MTNGTGSGFTTIAIDQAGNHNVAVAEPGKASYSVTVFVKAAPTPQPQPEPTPDFEPDPDSYQPPAFEWSTIILLVLFAGLSIAGVWFMFGRKKK